MRLKRLISAFIACAMLVTFMPMQAFAAPDDELYEVSQSQQDNSTVLNNRSESDVEDDISTQQVNHQWKWIVGDFKEINCGRWTGLVRKADKYWTNSDYRVVKLTDYRPIIGTVQFNAISPGKTTIILYEDKEHTKVRYQWEITVEEDNNKSTDRSRESFEFSANSSNVDVAYAYYVYRDVASDLYPLQRGETICLPGKAKDYPIAFYVKATKGYVPESRFECAGSDGEYYPIGTNDNLPQSKQAQEEGYTKEFSFTGNKVGGDRRRAFTIKVVPVEVTVQYDSGSVSDDVLGMPENDDTIYMHEGVDDKSEYQHEIVLPSQEPSREGYTFKGWKLESDGITLNVEELYQPGAKITLDDNTWISATEEQATITFVAQWEKDEESAGSTAAYFYVLKPEFEGDPSTATPENFYYVGSGSIENPSTGEAKGQQYTEPQEPVADLPSDITAKLENIVWYYVSQANGANSNGGTPVVPDGITTWHVDGYLTAPLTVQAVDENNSMLEVTDWQKSESVRVGNEYTVVVGKDNNATIEVPPTITVDGRHYAYDAPKQDEQNGDPLSGKMQLNGATVKIPYAPDNNDNGKPDILEDTYTLTFDANGGKISRQNLYEDPKPYWSGDVATPAVVESFELTAPDKAVLIGWSKEDTEEHIYTANDPRPLPQTVSEVRFEDQDITLYAVWGYDENNDGKPDVTEGQYLVSYAWTGAPEGVPLPAGKRYLAYTDVPVDSPYTKDTVVKGVQDGVKGFYTFSGWSTQDVTITADNQFKMPEKNVTLNGTWTFTKDENGDKIPDERQIFVNYRSNAERYGTVSAEAANKVFTFTDEEIKSGKLPEKTLSARATETSDGDFDRWTTSADFGTLFPVYRATLNVDVIFTVNQLGETLEVVANFDRETGGGGAHHPDAGDDDDDDNDRDDEDDTEESIDEEVPLAETLWLNTEDHYAYIVGYSEDGTVRPNANITRAEVATIFFRLLTDEARDQFWMTSNNFSDVLPNDWYNNAVSTMVNMGIIQGYEDGTFRPNANITRAEFAAIAARFMSSGYDVEEDLFTDIANHWARESINDAAMAGWINGYEDGAFRPDAAITRAEAVTLVNNVLQRKPDADHMFDSMIKWPDNPEGTWYYEAIQEATNSHDYDLFEDAEYETWTALQENRDWAALEKDWVNTHRTGGEVA